MTKAEIVARISDKLGIEKVDVQLTVESLMQEVISSLESGENVYLRGFGSCLLYTSPSPRDVEESRMPSSA